MMAFPQSSCVINFHLSYKQHHLIWLSQVMSENILNIISSIQFELLSKI